MTGEVLFEAAGLEKSYMEGREKREILRGLDLEVHAGAFTAVFGPSGSGKSTLLNLLGLLDVPSGGSLLFGGRRASNMSSDERAALRREELGFVFQFDALLPEFTLLENVAMPLRLRGESAAAAERKAAEAIRRLGLGRVRQSMPQTLSGGEKQRAQIARALIGRPKAILADEPSGNLDRDNAKIVFETLHNLTRDEGLAVVLVTHDEDAARYADRTLRLVDGKLEKRFVK